MKLAFDHRRIVEDAVARASTDLETTSLATAFVGPSFTLSELRSVYEAVWDTKLDAANFRRSVLASDTVEPTGIRSSPGDEGGRPPELYRASLDAVQAPPIRKPRSKPKSPSNRGSEALTTGACGRSRSQGDPDHPPKGFTVRFVAEPPAKGQAPRAASPQKRPAAVSTASKSARTSASRTPKSATSLSGPLHAVVRLLQDPKVQEQLVAASGKIVGRVEEARAKRRVRLASVSVQSPASTGRRRRARTPLELRQNRLERLHADRLAETVGMLSDVPGEEELASHG